MVYHSVETSLPYLFSLYEYHRMYRSSFIPEPVVQLVTASAISMPSSDMLNLSESSIGVVFGVIAGFLRPTKCWILIRPKIEVKISTTIEAHAPMQLVTWVLPPKLKEGIGVPKESKL